MEVAFVLNKVSVLEEPEGWETFYFVLLRDLEVVSGYQDDAVVVHHVVDRLQVLTDLLTLVFVVIRT